MSYQSIVTSAIEKSIGAFIKSAAEKFNIDEKELMQLWNSSLSLKPSTTVKSPPVSGLGSENSALSSAILSAMKKDELVDMAKSRGLSHSGTKDAIIERLINTGSKVPAKAVPAKETKKKEKPAASQIVAITPIQRAKSVEIKPNKFKNYEHVESGLVFDNINGKVVGKQNTDGTISSLTDSDIEQCKRYGFGFVMPTNLNKKVVDAIDEDEIVDDKVDEEIVEEDDEDENVDDFLDGDEVADEDD